MAMTGAQEQAFNAASGGVEINVLSLLCIGGLLAVLFVWAAWAWIDVYEGWRNQDIRTKSLVRFVVKTILLLVLSIWMFAS
ncbi:TPA: TIGR03758 family integrating conjugative element protein [Serratia rubidaea]|nr:TIGR03758 family integrating conjugative element protein [Serratia rubidaea]HDJ1451140.1 TIGR03758 family integrating conjugative element protein [Serratia rubidaea]HDJ1464199.1 TIGR03758 family integrating conjugative element protein [Serratia rubidaea]HDJ2774946.1 TIGR03758 family integrating conjugative element protein [Serratia rubidaea]